MSEFNIYFGTDNWSDYELKNMGKELEDKIPPEKMEEELGEIFGNKKKKS